MAVGCENHAIAPVWLECLPIESKNKIIDRMSDIADIHSEVDNDYLANGLEEISDWKFCEIVSNIGIEERL